MCWQDQNAKSPFLNGQRMHSNPQFLFKIKWSASLWKVCGEFWLRRLKLWSAPFLYTIWLWDSARLRHRLPQPHPSLNSLLFLRAAPSASKLGSGKSIRPHFHHSLPHDIIMSWPQCPNPKPDPTMAAARLSKLPQILLFLLMQEPRRYFRSNITDVFGVC
jgi:hypothetical protein